MAWRRSGAVAPGGQPSRFDRALSVNPYRTQAIEDWPWLDQAVLRASRSRHVCMTCHLFRRHPGPECIPVLNCLCIRA